MKKLFLLVLFALSFTLSACASGPEDACKKASDVEACLQAVATAEAQALAIGLSPDEVESAKLAAATQSAGTQTAKSGYCAFAQFANGTGGEMPEDNCGQ